jgi:hypothetical protein
VCRSRSLAIPDVGRVRPSGAFRSDGYARWWLSSVQGGIQRPVGALIAALVIRDVFTALVITAGLLGARVLEALAVLRGRRAIRGLLDGVIDPLALAEDVTSRFNTPPAV